MTDQNTDIIERFDPDLQAGQMVESEHLTRYRWATQFAPGRRVLDVACGTGYGCAMLAEAGAASVTGADIDADTVARIRPGLPEAIALHVADIAQLPFPADSFDLVVCFETIEHLREPEPALDELRRVLHPDGLLLISTPNRGIYPEGNPHHHHEYTPDEFTETLGRRFAQVTLRRQHTWISSALLDDEGFAAAGSTPLREVEVRKLEANQPGLEQYTVAIASGGAPPADHAVLSMNATVELKHWSGLWAEQHRVLDEQAVLLEAQAKKMSEDHQVLTELWNERQSLRGALLEAEGDLSRLAQLEADYHELLAEAQALRDAEARAVQAEQRAIAAEHERDDWRRRLAVVTGSRSWQLTGYARRLGAIARGRG